MKSDLRPPSSQTKRGLSPDGLSQPEARKSPANVGAVVSVRGSVVDVRFDMRLPPIYSVLHTGADKCSDTAPQRCGL